MKFDAHNAVSCKRLEMQSDKISGNEVNLSTFS